METTSNFRDVNSFYLPSLIVRFTLVCIYFWLVKSCCFVVTGVVAFSLTLTCDSTCVAILIFVTLEYESRSLLGAVAISNKS